MIYKLRELTEKQLHREENQDTKEKLFLIKEILKNDDCFMKITIDTAIAILNDLGFEKSQALEIYKEIIQNKR